MTSFAKFLKKEYLQFYYRLGRQGGTAMKEWTYLQKTGLADDAAEFVQPVMSTIVKKEHTHTTELTQATDTERGWPGRRCLSSTARIR